MSEFSGLVQAYYQNPVNNRTMNDATISRHEGNELCGDDLTVYLKIKSIDHRAQSIDIIEDWSYDGMPSMITQAAASFFSELIRGKTLDEVLLMDEKTMKDNDFIVSPRRRRASIIAILATRNAIHEYLKDGEVETFENLLVD